MTPSPDPAAPTGIVAVVVAHGSSPLLADTLDAVAAQDLAPDHVVLIRAGRTADATPGAAQPPSSPDASLSTDTITVDAPRARTLGDAVRAAAASEGAGPAMAQARWWWILHDDCAPEPACLVEQWRVADRGRTIALVGAKQLSWDGDQLLEAGIQATRSARRLEAVTPGEIDQGQYDGRSDVLGVGTVGMLVARETWDRLGGTDPALGPFGDGLEFSRRVHRAGHRVVLAPRARLRHARRSWDAHPDDSFRERRTAQLYTWLASVAWWQLPLLALWLLVWSPARALGRILTGRRNLAGDELAAWAALVALTGPLLRSRWRGRRQARVPRSVLRSLESRPRDLIAQHRLVRRIRRAERHADHRDPLMVASLRRHRLHAWAGAAGVVGVLTVASLLVWGRMLGGVAGSAWGGAPSSLSALWQSAWAAWTPGGDGSPGPADPLLVPLALISAPFALIGAVPATVWTGLLVLSAPLAALTAWALASALTSSIPARLAAACAWAALPALTVSASQGRLGVVLAHILMPLVLLGWIRMGRGPASWAAGVAAVALVGAAGAVPWLWGAALAGLLVGVLGALARPAGERRSGLRRSGARLVTLIPAGVILAPTAIRALTAPGGAVALLAPGGPGGVFAPIASWWMAAGVPAGASWIARPWLLAGLAPVLVIALIVGVLAMRGRAVGAMAVPALTAAVAVSVGVALARVTVAAVPTDAGQTPVSAWPAPALSVAACALLVAGCRLTALSPAPSGARDRRPERAAAAVVAVAAAFTWGAWAALGPLTAGADGTVADHVHGASQQVPSITREAQRSERQGRLLVLSQTADADAPSTLEARLLRGDGSQLTDSTALSRWDAWQRLASGSRDAADTDLARTALTLISAPDAATAADLARHGIDTVLIADTRSEPGASLAEALTRTPGLQRVGDTDYGTVWRVRPDEGLPARAVLVGGQTWTLVAAGPLRVDTTLDASAAGTLVLAERADPAWRATVDEQALTPVDDPDGAWRQAFDVPAGGGRLVVEYRPWWLPAWRVAAGLALTLAAVAAIPTRRRR